VRCPARELESISAAVRAATQHLCSANQGLAAALLERDRTHAELLTVMRGLDDTVKLRTAELEAAVQRAESASRSKSEFVASTSHELRTPLNVIIGMSELLIDRSLGELNARQLEAAQAVEEAGRHLLSLINDILDLSKIEAGKLEIDLQPTSIRDACEASLRLVRHPAAEKRHFIAESLDVRHDTIPADPRRLKQMLVNLLSNAVKFTPDGGRVILQVSELENPPETHFTVADTGIGIAAEDLPRLFQPFQQLESSLSRRFGGTGLGLVLVRRLAELHGGRIEVYSKPGEGSRFTVVLPTAGRVSEESQQQVDDYKELAPGTRILVADPSVPDQFIYRNCPAFAHCQIEFASTASEALGSAFSRTPDLMLMDPELPGMEPIRLIQLLRTDPRTATTPIILACAPPSPSEATRFKEAGVSALVSKPVRIRDLETTAAQLAGSSRARIP
jgi:signal transduction histidine kinase